MKRKLSSQAIKAMAIGMAFTMATSTAISGTVVNAFAIDELMTSASSVVGADKVTVSSKNTGENKENVTITLTAKDGTFSIKEADSFVQAQEESGLTGFTVNTTDGAKATIDNLTGTLNAEGTTITVDVPIDNLTGAKAVTISYTAPTNNGKQKIQFTPSQAFSEEEMQQAGQAEDLVLTDVPVPVGKNNADITAPTLTVGDNAYNSTDNTITLTANEQLKAISSITAPGGFAIAGTKAGAKEYEIKNVVVNAGSSGTAGTVVLTVGEKAGSTGLNGQGTPVLADGTYNITYNSETASNNAIKDANGNKLADITGTSLQLTVSEGQEPSETTTNFTTAKLEDDKKTITLTANNGTEKLTDNTIKGADGFSLKKDGQAVTGNNITQVVVNNGKSAPQGTTVIDIIKLTLTNELTAPGEYTVEYKAGTIENITVTSDAKFTIEDKTQKEVFEYVGENGTYKFEQLKGTDSKPINEVALVGFTAKGGEKADTNGNTFVGDEFKTPKGTYKLTQIGATTVDTLSGGTSDLKTITEKDLAGHLNSVKVIEKNAFNGNTALENVTFPAVTTVKEGAFNGATKLKNIELPKVEKVEKDAFKGAANLTTVDLGSQTSGKVTIAEDTFSGNTSLKTITTNPQSQEDIADKTKNSGGNPEIISISEDNYNIPNAKIDGGSYYKTKDGLTFKAIDSSRLSFIGYSEFKTPTKPNTLDGSDIDKAYLVTYDKDNGMVTLKDGEQSKPVTNLTVKQGNNTLTFVTNGTGVTLTGISSTRTYAEETTGNKLENGTLKTATGETYSFNTIGDGTDPVITGNTLSVTEILANNLNNVTTISKNAFKDYGKNQGRDASNLVISFPAVTTVGESAFNGATAFKSVDLPVATTLGKKAFSGATSLTSINVPKVQTVGTLAFSGASSLTNIKLPSVTNIEASAFNGTTALTEIYLGDNSNITISETAFTGAGSSSPNSLKITSNNQTVIDKVKEITNGSTNIKVENAAPFITGAKVGAHGNTIEVTVSEPVYIEDNDKDTVKQWFKVNAKIDQTAVEAITINTVTVGTKEKPSNTITITLTEGAKLDWRHTVTLEHTAPSPAEPPAQQSLIKDVVKDSETANSLEQTGETPINVTNNSTKPAPVKIEVKDVRNRVVTDSSNTLVKLLIPKSKYGIELVNSITGNAGFKLTKAKEDNGKYTDDAITINSVSIVDDPAISSSSPDTINVVLSVTGTNLTASDTNLKVSYDGSSKQIVAKKGDVISPIAPIEPTLIANQLDGNPPTLSSEGTSYDKAKHTITLPATEYLLPVTNNNTVDDTPLFKVEVETPAKNPITLPVTKVEVGNDSKNVILTVDDKNLPANATKLKVTYTKPTSIEEDDIVKPIIRDANYNQLASITNAIEISLTANQPDVATFAQTRATTPQSASVTAIEKDDNATLKVDDINNMLKTGKIKHIGANTLVFDSAVELDFSNVVLDDNFTIDTNAFGNSTNKVIFTGVTNDNYKLRLANLLKATNNNNVYIGNQTPDEIINQGQGQGGGSTGSGGSTGGSAGGGGANIGTVNTDNNNQNNNNNNNKPVVEDKELSFDVINLPSITGEPKVFNDVSANYWAKPHIDKLSTAGIINGDDKGNFNPNGQTKRADVTIMLVNLLGLTPEVNNKFIDVNPNAYYAAYVGAASSYGIVNGSNGMFNPENVISRQDTMVMIAQILKGLNLNVNTDTSSLTKFSDVSKISPYANESVAILVNSGIISGNNGKLNPTNPVTRAEMATIMSKLYDILASSK